MSKLKVWFMPAIEVAEKPRYEKEVDSIEQAVFLLNEIAQYTLLLGDASIMPDYSNVGGIMMLENGEWVDWYDEESGIDDPEEYLENINEPLMMDEDN